MDIICFEFIAFMATFMFSKHVNPIQRFHPLWMLGTSPPQGTNSLFPSQILSQTHGKHLSLSNNSQPNPTP